jgi:predicted amidophosphoribosyltransferase
MATTQRPRPPQDTGVSFVTCAGGCGTKLPADYEGELCPACIATFKLLKQWQASRCEAKGKDADGEWNCNDTAETRKFGRYCIGHYAQINRGGPLKRLKKRQTGEMFAGWIAVLEEHGFTVIPPEDPNEKL